MAVRGLFGVSPYSKPHRAEVSSVYQIQRVPTPNAIGFVSTPDRRPPQPQESAAVYSNKPAVLETITIRRFFTTDPPAKAKYPAAISLVRGHAGPPAPPPPEFPPIPLVNTPVPWQYKYPDGNQVTPSNILPYDPLGMGAWIATTVPPRPPYGIDSVVTKSLIILPVVDQTIRTFIRQSLSFKPTVIQRDNSQVRSPQIASVAFLYEIQRFLNIVPPYKGRGEYARDLAASIGLFGVTNLIPQPAGGTLYDIYHYYANHN